MRLLTGIDLLADLGPTRRLQEGYVTYDRSYGYWIVGNVAAFLITAGIAHTALLVTVTRDAWRERRPGMETVVWVILLGLSLAGEFKGETDHNWLFLLPLMIAVSAPAIERMRGVAAAGLTQAIGTEVLFYTGW